LRIIKKHLIVAVACRTLAKSFILMIHLQDQEFTLVATNNRIITLVEDLPATVSLKAVKSLSLLSSLRFHKVGITVKMISKKEPTRRKK
jgi:hypothetical protein